MGRSRGSLGGRCADWEGCKLSDDCRATQNFVFLDNVYPSITKDSWVALESP